jgi:hypothetical protein
MQKKSMGGTQKPDWATASTGQRLPADYRVAAKRIGSIQNGSINFTQDMKYFEGADHHQIRQGVHGEARVVQDTIDRDLLGVKKSAWNGTVGIVGHP